MTERRPTEFSPTTEGEKKVMTDQATLTYDVLVLDEEPSALTEVRLPDGGPLTMAPVSITLIQGERDAVLVDPPFTSEQAQKVGDWIEKSGKRLKFIYVTHGHADHWFTADELLKRFPGVPVHATAASIELMHKSLATRAETLDLHFPGKVPVATVQAVPVPEDGFELEGNRLISVDVGHTDTDSTTVLHVPSIGLVVAGDAVYNGVHLHLDEGKNGGLHEWLTALEKIESLQPRAVVAGHKNRELSDDPANVAATRAYLQDAIRLLDSDIGPIEFYEEMLRRYPDYLTRTTLFSSAAGLLRE